MAEANRTINIAKRKEIFCQLEDIQMTRGTAGIAFWTKLWHIASKKYQGVFCHPGTYDIFNEVWLDPNA